MNNDITITSSISKFFYHIEMPLNSSAFILKMAFIIAITKGTKINFDLLKQSCNKLNFDWSTECNSLRTNIKKWFAKSFNTFKQKYTNINFISNQTLLIINMLFNAYNQHTHEHINLWNYNDLMQKSNLERDFRYELKKFIYANLQTINPKKI